MENQAAEHKLSVWGEISFGCAITAILFVVLGIVINVLFRTPQIAGILFLGSAILIFAGIICGAAGTFTKRVWSGLVFNLLLGAIIFALTFASMFFYCCQPPPLNY